MPGLCQTEMSWRRVVRLAMRSHRSKVNNVPLQKPSTHTPVAHSKVESHFLRRYIHFITVIPTVLRSDVTCCRCWDIAGKHANLEDMPRLVVVLVVVAGTVIGRV